MGSQRVTGSAADGAARPFAMDGRPETPRRPPSPLLVATGDPHLLDDILRLSAATSLEVEVVDEVSRIRTAWATAPLILVGADLAGTLARVAPPRRPDVLVVGRASLEPVIWQAAVALGVEHVVELPEGERWLVDRLGDAGDGPHRHGTVVAVIGSRGGAGASTLAASLALTASTRGVSTLLVDADPWAGGLDVLLGAEMTPGLRWPDLASARGRLPVAALAQSLPQVGGVSLVSWDRRPRAPFLDALTSVIGAGRRGFDLVIVDVARPLLCPEPMRGHADGGEGAPDREVLLPVFDSLLLVVPAEVRAVTAAAQLLPDLRAVAGRVDIIHRSLPHTMIDSNLVGEVLGCQVVTEVTDEPSLTGSIDEGNPTLSGERSALGRTAADLLEHLRLGVGDRSALRSAA